ncbi:MAG: sigma-54-dependent Fis family transcriptional regulator [Planctomycetes bacterium]|nr:sigma-54-dependent Fis family transcriptional regulator [Planctomycetota bacterium]
MSAMDASTELRARLERLLEDARERGLSAELVGWWNDLRAAVPGVPSVDGAPIPMQFGMVGDSPPMRALFELLGKVAPSDVSVLVQGETGTGKELVARALHEHSRRKSKLFLAENCAAVPASLLESELFGHKRGSFTGAIADRPGHFVAADGGTVFLDEIGDMPLAMQSKLLRVLQEGEVRPVGSNKLVKVDVRVVAASNKDLPVLCKQGGFREDLYYRLNVVTLHLPALRERRGDVAHLARFFLAKTCEELGRRISISSGALAALERHSWPGNVRELENVIRRAAVFAREEITPAELPPAIAERKDRA